jgi:CHAT domain-containing protein
MSCRGTRRIVLPVFATAILFVAVLCSAQSAVDLEKAEKAAQSASDLVRQRRYPEAISVAQEGLQKSHALSIISPPRFKLIDVLANAEFLNRQAGAAIQLLEETLDEIHRDHSGHVTEALICEDLATLYASMGRHQEAEDKLLRADAILEAQVPPDNLQIAKALQLLASQQTFNSKYLDVQSNLKKALRLLPDPPNRETATVTKYILLGLAQVYAQAGEQDKADGYRERALSISSPESEPGSLPNEYLEPAMRGVAAMNAGNPLAASKEFEQQLKFSLVAFGSANPLTLAAKQYLAIAYVTLHEREKAKPLMLDLLDSVYVSYENDFPLVSETDRLELTKNAEFRLALFCSYVAEFYPEDADLAGRMYDFALWSKGAILTTSQSVQQRIQSSHDSELILLQKQLDDDRVRYQQAASSASPNIQLKSEMRELEDRIVRRLGLTNPTHVSWKDVQTSLEPDQAAIEILRFFDTRAGQSSSGASYAALIVRREWRTPRYVYLGSAADIEGAQAQRYKLYVTAMLAPQARRTPTFEFWTKMQDALGEKAHRLYLSPDGILNNFSFAVIPDPKGGLLIDNYDIRLLSSTRDLLIDSSRTRQSSVAVVIGNPDFDLSQESYNVALKKYSVMLQRPCTEFETHSPVNKQSRPWQGLPETEVEVRTVQSTLCQHGWVTHSLTYDSALKELAVTEIQKGSQLVHFATHGFFKARQTDFDSPMLGLRTDAAMLNSGLVFAGANSETTQSGSSIAGARATLTAFEISSLNLRGTELVVLSACDTGINDTSTAREVFGLRRAFQMAGASSILMTMWSVPSDETTPIIEDFYQNWIAGGENHKGMDKYEALRIAQLNARRANSMPNSWGAFVLMGK